MAIRGVAIPALIARVDWDRAMLWAYGFTAGLWGTTIGFLYGVPTPPLLGIFMTVTVLDWVSGMCAARRKGERWSWQKAQLGVLKCVGYLGLAALAHQLDRTLGILIVATKQVSNPVLSLSLGAFIGADGLSVIDNFRVCGCKIPKGLRAAGEKLQDAVLEENKGGRNGNESTVTVGDRGGDHDLVDLEAGTESKTSPGTGKADP